MWSKKKNTGITFASTSVKNNLSGNLGALYNQVWQLFTESIKSKIKQISLNKNKNVLFLYNKTVILYILFSQEI